MMRKSSGKLIRWPGGTTRKEKPILRDLKKAESGMEEGDVDTNHTVLADHTTSTMTPGIPPGPSVQRNTTTTPKPLMSLIPLKQVRPKVLGPCFMSRAYEHLTRTCPTKRQYHVPTLLKSLTAHARIPIIRLVLFSKCFFQKVNDFMA